MKATESGALKEPAPLSESSGLGSLQGIRWLLGVGALVLAVSVYRLVEAQWAGMSVIAQFLTLVGGSLGIFGAAELTRHRLRLPIAGSALQLLFSVLVPVLSWGAAYLDLLGASGGALVYAVAIVALLGALRRCLKSALRYDGMLYPAAFGLLTMSLPLLSRASLGDWGYIGAAMSLGVVFYVGSQHINRFLFHRDRRDGIDRPIHALPFVALAILYAACLSVLSLPATFIALPIMIVGAALVATGEEYYYALVRSRREQPNRWPRRSVALLALGFALLSIAGPLAFLDSSGHVAAVVFCGLATILFRWSLRYDSVPAHVLAMGASVIGYIFLPTLMPQLAVEKVLSLTDLLGLVAPAAKMSFGQLGLAVLFTLFARRCAGVARAHAVGASLHLIAIVALSGFAGATIVAPLALALAALSTVVTRRREWIVAGHAALGATVLAWGGSYGMELLAVVMTAVVMSRVALGGSTSARYVSWPAFFWASVITVSGALTLMNGGAIEVLAAGILFMALGHRLQWAPAIVVGIGAVSLGIHAELAFTLEAPMMMVVAATQLMFAGSVVLQRWGSERWKAGAHLSMVGHGALGILWLVVALGTGPSAVTLEPVIFALFGWAILWHGLRERDETDAAVGLGFLIAYVPFHLAALSLITSIPLMLLIMLACMFVARAVVPRRIEAVVDRLMRVWRVLAIAAALVFVGTEASALALAVVLAGMFLGKAPYRSLLLVLGHALIWFEGATTYGLFPLALAEALASGFAAFAALALGWILLVEWRDVKALRVWVLGLESLAVWVYFIGFVPSVVWTLGDYVALIVVAAAFATRHAIRSFMDQSVDSAWAMQMWLALGVLVGFYAGWVSFGNGRSAYVLLATGMLQYGAAALWKRSSGGKALSSSSSLTGQALTLLGGAIALARVQAWPLFIASVFYLILASRATRRVAPAIASAMFLGAGLLAVASGQGVGVEFYALAPGFTLVALALLLSEEMGPRWSRHVFTAGAAFIYATPVLALYDEITWTWQAVLLLLTVGFGTASFWLRSRPLLTVSTAALVIDLACFVIMIRATEPLLLWVGGVFLGVALMSLAAYLEYRREGLAQQFRVFGRELAAWY